MPLITRIVRRNQPLSIRWGNFHVAAMALASGFDSGQEPLSAPTKIYRLDPILFDCYPDAPFPVSYSLAFQVTDYGALAKTPLNNGLYTLKFKHKFWDTTDGEILTLEPGDELFAYRN